MSVRLARMPRDAWSPDLQAETVASRVIEGLLPGAGLGHPGRAPLRALRGPMRPETRARLDEALASGATSQRDIARALGVSSRRAHVLLRELRGEARRVRETPGASGEAPSGNIPGNYPGTSVGTSGGPGGNDGTAELYSLQVLIPSCVRLIESLASFLDRVSGGNYPGTSLGTTHSHGENGARVSKHETTKGYRPGDGSPLDEALEGEVRRYEAETGKRVARPGAFKLAKLKKWRQDEGLLHAARREAESTERHRRIDPKRASDAAQREQDAELGGLPPDLAQKLLRRRA